MQALSLSDAIPLPAMGSWRDAAKQCGFTIDPVFKKVGIGSADPLVQHRLTPPDLLKAFSMCVKRSQGRHFPFALGEVFVFEHFAELEAFVSSCSTIRDVLEVASWAKGLFAPWMTLHLDEVGSEAHLRVETVVSNAPAMAQVREAVLAALHQIGKRMTRGANWLLSVRVSSRQPSNPRIFTEHFGVPVFFDDHSDALVMDRRWLDLPLSTSAPAVLSQARQLVERRLNREMGERRILGDLRWTLERRPELLREGLEAAATAMGLHPRTLQRRLQAEGVKYVDIQSDAKRHRAQTMLRRRAISMEVISSELGFSDRRAFTYAFKRWTGLAPSVYRAQLEALAVRVPQTSGSAHA